MINKMNKILITYATSEGSTKSIAERLQTKLSAANIGPVTIEPASKKLSIEGSNVIIIGSCIHIGSWLSAAKSFSKSHAAYIKEKKIPVWAFSVGLPDAKGEKIEQEKLEKWTKDIYGEQLKEHKFFQGAYLETGVWWPFRTMFRWMKVPYQDRRDWEAVEGWADGIVKELGKEVREAPAANEETVVR